MIPALLLALLATAPLYWTTGYVATGNATASGVMPQVGRTVACPDSVAFGTVVLIEGYGLRTCQDRCPCDHFDLFVASKREAYDVTGWRRVAVVGVR